MEEWKIGEIRQVNGEWYQCVKGTKCYECAFAKKHCNENPLFEAIGSCSKYYRKDATSVIFKKLEKTGLSYYNSDNKLCQEYKCYIVPLITDDIVYVLADNRVVIEVKQNKKEDMEEKKLNLKPFDLEAAKAGKPVCTRDGRKARIICFDRFCCDEISTIVACVLSKDGKDENVIIYSSDGFMADKQHPYDDDLMMLPEKKKGWINIYEDMRIYASEEGAKMGISPERTYITTTKVEWEE